MRRLLLLIAAAITAGVVAVSASATTPPGAGLYGDHESTCSGIFDYGPAPVTLVPGSGSTFWVAGHHLLIQSFEYRLDGTDEWIPVSFGKKTGKMTTPMETCRGYFAGVDGAPGYEVISHSLVIP